MPVAVGWDEGRLVELAGGRLGPAAVVEAVLIGAVFLSAALPVEVAVGRLVAAVAEPPAGAVFGRVLGTPAGLIAPAAGCCVGTETGSWMGGKIKRRSKQKEKQKHKIIDRTNMCKEQFKQFIFFYKESDLREKNCS